LRRMEKVEHIETTKTQSKLRKSRRKMLVDDSDPPKINATTHACSYTPGDEKCIFGIPSNGAMCNSRNTKKLINTMKYNSFL